MSRPARLLTVAGSDSGGGAGIQADLKTFAAHGVYGMSAITAVTAQNTREVRVAHALPPDLVAAQIDAVIEDIGVDAVKVGMLANAAIVAAVAERLAAHRGPERPVPVVLDPVMVAKSGDPLLAADAVEVLARRLLPLATVITPNLPEALRLATGDSGDSGDSGGSGEVGEAERRALALALAARGPAVLLKGGHASGKTVVDLLAVGERVHRFEHPRIETRATHGTGCTLSAAIAARLGRGDDLLDAVDGAIDYLHRAIAAAAAWVPALGATDGHGPVDHLHSGVAASAT